MKHNKKLHALLFRLFAFSRIYFKIYKVALSWRLSKFGKLPTDILDIHDDKVYLVNHRNVSLLEPSVEFILCGLHLIKGIINNERFSISRIDHGALTITNGEITLLLKTWEEIFIFNEIFVSKEYEFNLGCDVKVIDVGANTGTASIFFASKENVISITSFEIFPQTAKRMEENLAMNPLLAKKIRLHQVGLGSSDSEMLLDYYADMKGSVGLFGVGSHAARIDSETRLEKVNVQLRDAAAVFEECISTQPSLPLVAKIDCEGAEYQIIERLSDCLLLGRIDAFMIEWHERGSDEIVNQLTQAGHAVWLMSHPGSPHGMIYSSLRRTN